jgi:membrane protein YqaA with SNARE-associated domain
MVASEWLALLGATFLSATVFPFPSELVVLGLAARHPDVPLLIVAIATLGNTLGGLTTYAIGRLFPKRPDEGSRVEQWVRRFGALALLLAWLPIIGDAFCGVAGWLRLPPWRCLIWMAIGKGARYAVLVGLLRM